jgi:hypothetical protein
MTGRWVKYANGVWKRRAPLKPKSPKQAREEHLRTIHAEYEVTRENVRLRNLANDAEWTEAGEPLSRRFSSQVR